MTKKVSNMHDLGEFIKEIGFPIALVILLLWRIDKYSSEVLRSLSHRIDTIQRSLTSALDEHRVLRSEALNLRGHLEEIRDNQAKLTKLVNDLSGKVSRSLRINNIPTRSDDNDEESQN